MQTTAYFREQVLIKRPYLKMEWIGEAIANPLRREVQSDGRIRLWWRVPSESRYLRVVLLEDGITVHNAFFDRGFTE